VAVTLCPTGIAHTIMAAEGVRSDAESLGHHVKVESQGSVGSQNILTAQDVAQADQVIIAADTKVDKSRFASKLLYETSTKAAIHDGVEVVEKALAEATVFREGRQEDLISEVQRIKKSRAAARTGVHRHLMTGVSYMLPFVVAGGFRRDAGQQHWLWFSRWYCRRGHCRLFHRFLEQEALIAASDSFRVIPSIMVGSAVTGAISMVSGCALRVHSHAINRASADFVFSSPLVDLEYPRLLPDYEAYQARQIGQRMVECARSSS
jgi:fructose-specific phosphotransferase system IIB component